MNTQPKRPAPSDHHERGGVQCAMVVPIQIRIYITDQQ